MDNENSLISKLREARKKAKDPSVIEYRWGSFNVDALMLYNTTFRRVLGMRIEEFIARSREATGHVFVLDAMGAGKFFKDVGIDGGVALQLTDTRLPYEADRDAENNIALVAGDILQGSTWAKVDDYIRKNKAHMNGGFDLITCRPEGGWDVVGSRDLEWVITNKLFKLLSPQGGTLAIDYIDSLSSYSNWIDVLRSLPGLNVRVDSGVSRCTLGITRNSDETVKLPRYT